MIVKKTSLEPKIVEEANVFDDHLLDIIGNEFKFDHPKGLSEWLKNSADAYIREGISDSEQNVVLRLINSRNKEALFEMVDFVGMTENDINKAFKRWGDPEAARRGSKKTVYGGHGNGGKFYMRQMFTRSYFVTYRNGMLNTFGFSSNKKYGFAKDFKNRKVAPEGALGIAQISDIYFPRGVKKAILCGKSGFTVVRGVGPSGMTNKIKVAVVIDGLKTHPQARRIIDRLNFWFVYSGTSDYALLKPNPIAPLPKFEGPFIISIPKKLPLDGEEGGEIEMSNKKYGPGRLIIRTSEEAFERGSRSSELNRVDIIGTLGVIATYQLRELGVTTFPQASFLYGECECPILEAPEMDCVKNDRDKLVLTPRSRALLAWVREEIDKLAGTIAEAERLEQKESQRKVSASYNQFLNKWKDRFMRRILADLINPLTGGAPGTGKDGSKRRAVLENPVGGLQFSYSKASIEADKIETLTLKASTPDPFPVGTVIRIASDNKLIELVDNQAVIHSETIKASKTGELVAVLDVLVVGKKEGVSGCIRAVAGKTSAKIDLDVIKSTNGDGSRGSKYPQVLLSGYDDDPLNLAPGGKVFLGGRDPLVYQRLQDVQSGIYWINTQGPLAKHILELHGGDHSLRWRDYLLQRYVDIFTKQALYELQKKDPDNFRAERIDNDILDRLTREVHLAAAQELSGFLFEEEFEPDGK